MMTDPAKKKLDKKIKHAYDSAKGFFDKDDHISALKKTENAISVHGKNELCAIHHDLQGDIFFKLAKETDNKDIKCVYLLASVDCYSSSILLSPNDLSPYYECARSLIELGDQRGVKRFYEKAKSKATRGLELSVPDPKDLKKQLLELKNSAIEKMNSNVADTSSLVVADTSSLVVADTTSLVTHMESEKTGEEDEERKRDLSVERLKSFWAKLDNKSKREFLAVDVAELKKHVESKYDRKVLSHFQKCVCADDLRWRYWRCNICAEVNFCFLDSKKHIVNKHVHKHDPGFIYPKRVDKVLANMITFGNWEPVDTVAAAELIKDRADRREEFVYVDGWCSDWPVAKDEERESILIKFAEVLRSVLEPNDTLPCTLWEWLMSYTEENVELPDVPGIYLDKCNFFESPQCICFLGLNQLKHILEYVRQLTTNVRTTSVSTVVNQFWNESLVKERIDLVTRDPRLLLDEKLLCDGEHLFDKIGRINVYDSSAIYEHVTPKGDKIVSWVLSCPEIDKKFVSQVAEGVHNVEIWFAVLRIVRRTNMKMLEYSARKQKMLTYDKMLDEAQAICEKEDQRKNANQRSRYALMLGMKCEELLLKQDDDDTKCFLRVVRDVLENVETPSVEAVDDMESMERISTLSKTAEDNDVKNRLLRLKKKLSQFHLIDSKILLNKFTKVEFDMFLPKLSAIDNRLVVLQFVKIFLREKLEEMMNNRAGPRAKKQRS